MLSIENMHFYISSIIYAYLEKLIIKLMLLWLGNNERKSTAYYFIGNAFDTWQNITMLVETEAEVRELWTQK